MGIASIPQRIRSLQRFPQILGVLFKYGFGDVVARIGLDSILHDLKRRLFPTSDPRFEQLTSEERVRLMLEELGPTFIKLGQVLATRPDLIPMPLVLELRKLQDKVKPFDTAGIRAHVEALYGRPLDTIFKEFDAQPLAAASIAQVHRATLLDGREVVLKVQRPNLERIIETDLSILSWLAETAEERIPEIRRYRPRAIVAEFEKSIVKEIDFTIEAYHIKRFAKNFQGDPTVYVPAVMEDLTTPQVLCEEFIRGTKLNDPAIHQRADIDLPALARNGVRFILEQALVHGFFHADPHPGNLFVLDGNRICPIDYGMMGSLDQERIDELLTFLVGVLTRDTDKLIRLFHRQALIDEHVNVRALKQDIDDLIARFESVELAKLDIGKYLQSVFEVIVRHEVQLPADLLLVGKALATIEGVGRDIHPQLNTLEEIRPVILKIYLRRLADPAYHTRAPRRVMDDLGHLLETGPADLRLVLRRLRDGELTLRHDVRGYEDAARDQAQALNRLALALVTCTLIGAAALLLARTGVTIGGAPLEALLGLVALALGVLYGLVLFVGFVRSGGF
ncbi:MAG: AarF/UbiB family protein [Planctomycetes bacterium]|nr:AarF/UbiB family protein [Planctomycetota bacterium]